MERSAGGLLCARRKAPGYGRPRRTGYGQGYGDRGYGRSAGGGGDAPAGNTHSLLLLRASSQFASIDDTSQTGLEPAGSFTLESWCYASTLPGTGEVYTIHNKFGSGDGSYTLSFQESGGNYYVRFTIYNGTVYGINWQIAPGAATWFHLGVSYDATGQWQSNKLYLDGVDQGAGAVAFGTGTNIPGAVSDRSDPFVVGARPLLGRYWNGRLDEVRVWSTLRSAAEIAANYNREISAQPGLVGYWKFNNDYVDASGNGNDLAPTNAPTFSEETPF